MLLEIGRWIDGSVLQDGALWALRGVPGFPPLIQTAHILGVAVVMGTAVLLNLRALGLAAPGQRLDEMARRTAPWLAGALAGNLVSGSFLLFARPFRYFGNPVFAWKLGFLVPALLLTAAFCLAAGREADFWERSAKRRLAAKAVALPSLGLWIMTAMAGRWIAYAEYLFDPA